MKSKVNQSYKEQHILYIRSMEASQKKIHALQMFEWHASASLSLTQCFMTLKCFIFDMPHAQSQHSTAF